MGDIPAFTPPEVAGVGNTAEIVRKTGDKNVLTVEKMGKLGEKKIYLLNTISDPSLVQEIRVRIGVTRTDLNSNHGGYPYGRYRKGSNINMALKEDVLAWANDEVRGTDVSMKERLKPGFAEVVASIALADARVIASCVALAKEKRDATIVDQGESAVRYLDDIATRMVLKAIKNEQAKPVEDRENDELVVNINPGGKLMPEMAVDALMEVFGEIAVGKQVENVNLVESGLDYPGVATKILTTAGILLTVVKCKNIGPLVTISLCKSDNPQFDSLGRIHSGSNK